MEAHSNFDVRTYQKYLCKIEWYSISLFKNGFLSLLEFVWLLKSFCLCLCSFTNYYMQIYQNVVLVHNKLNVFLSNFFVLFSVFEHFRIHCSFCLQCFSQWHWLYEIPGFGWFYIQLYKCISILVPFGWIHSFMDIFWNRF